MLLLGACGDGLGAPAPVPGQTAGTVPSRPARAPEASDISVPSTDDLDALLAEIDQLVAELSNSVTENEGDLGQ